MQTPHQRNKIKKKKKKSFNAIFQKRSAKNKEKRKKQYKNVTLSTTSFRDSVPPEEKISIKNLKMNDHLGTNTKKSEKREIFKFFFFVSG